MPNRGPYPFNQPKKWAVNIFPLCYHYYVIRNSVVTLVWVSKYLPCFQRSFDFRYWRVRLRSSAFVPAVVKAFASCSCVMGFISALVSNVSLLANFLFQNRVFIDSRKLDKPTVVWFTIEEGEGMGRIPGWRHHYFVFYQSCRSLLDFIK